MPLDGNLDEFNGDAADHSGGRWMAVIGICLLMLGLACTL
jgi:hypothetical protein